MISFDLIEEAIGRISPHILRTPITFDPNLNTFLKWENHQTTGSFKLRGAMNKILALRTSDVARGLVAASAGNHGQGVAMAGNLVGAEVTIFASDHAEPLKITAMERLGAHIHLVQGGYAEAEMEGILHSQMTGKVWVSPYNDPLVIAGQATLAVEILQAQADTRNCTWVVPVGGGGLISGIALALENITPTTRIIGVQSDASPYFHAIYHQGSQAEVVELPSLADGLAGAVEEGAVTIPLVNSLVDDLLLVSEEEIAQAILYAWETYHEKIEGSAAVVLAALITGKITSPTVSILSGGNISPELHQSLIENKAWK